MIRLKKLIILSHSNLNTCVSVGSTKEEEKKRRESRPYLPAQVSEADVELVLLAGLLLICAAVL